VAHLLAKYAVKFGVNQLWHSTPPDCIRDALLLEVSGFCSSSLIF
jgi:hypothetical protein